MFRQLPLLYAVVPRGHVVPVQKDNKFCVRPNRDSTQPTGLSVPHSPEATASCEAGGMVPGHAMPIKGL